MVSRQLTFTEPLGCVLDGARGQAANDLILIRMALEHGFTYAEEQDHLIVAAAINGQDMVNLPGATTIDAQHDVLVWEFVPEIAGEALAHLQSVTAEGLCWEWVDGDLFLDAVD